MPKYYDWRKTFSYDAKITIVMSARGFGKTYGLRKQAVKDFIQDGYRFVEIARYKSALQGEDAIQAGYFDKLEAKNEFPNHIFKTEGKTAYIADKPKNEDDKPNWQKIGFFVALSDMQKLKGRTFANVKRVIFDEFIIDKRTRSRYLTGEFDLFINVLDSVIREEPGVQSPVRAYLLGNACDLTNPYLSRLGIRKAPDFGYSWHYGKDVLVHYCNDRSYSEGKRDTLVGRLVKGTKEEAVIVNNEFARVKGSGFIGQKPKHAKFTFGIAYNDRVYGIWEDDKEGYYYVNTKVPNNTNRPVYALTNADSTPNYIIAKRVDKVLQAFVDMYYMGIVKYDTSATCEEFMQALALFGVR